MQHVPKRIGIKKVVGVFLLSLVLGNILLATPAQAQLGGAVVSTVVEDVPRRGSEAKAEVELGFADALFQSVVSTAYNTANFFLRKLAVDTARFLGESAAGKKSLVFETPSGSYIEDVANGTLGEAIGSIGAPFGLNLCDIPDINFKVFLQIGIGDLYGQGSPKPRCDWAEIKNNWSAEGFERKFGKGASKLIPQKWSDVISVQQSDFGIALGAVAQLDTIRAKASAAAELERTIGGGFRDLKDKISDTILTPARYFESEALKNLSAGNQLTSGLNFVAAGIASGAAQAIPAAVQTFLGSFVSTLLEQTFQQGLFQPSTFDPNFFGIGAARRVPTGVLSSIQTAQVVTVSDYDVLANYVSCPQNPKLDNCVMDQSLFQALSRAAIDKPLTIREAIDAGLLHGDWPLISPRRETAEDGTGNSDRTCYSKAYCYSNIQKLRKVRVLPLGFEIAALKADPDDPQAAWTLKKIVDNFDNCSPDGAPNPQYPYCHLINPNWVLRSFPASCQSRVTGPNLLTPQAPDRAQECVDVATCLRTDANGTCIAQGYCTKEKTVWRLLGDQCAPEYATCRTYRSANGDEQSYLTRTLDFSSCSPDAVGCRAFSTERDAQGNWIPSISANLSLNTIQLGRNQTLHLNQAGIQKTCPAGAVGCNAYITALRTSDQTRFVQNQAGGYIQAPVNTANRIAYLKKAPDYLGCYDTNGATPEIDWPRTRTEAQTAFNRNAACANYAAACAPDEVGCESYRSVTDPSAPAIPGVIGANACAPVCAGYDTFKQEATAFEAEQFPLYFIPSQGDQCSIQYAGCTQFTNIDASAQGGERLEYYTSLGRCERPQVNGGETYYSWEGSDREGFVLRVHRLVALDAAGSEFHVNSARGAGVIAGVDYNTLFAVGSPTYVDDSSQILRAAIARCNEVNYNLGVNNPIDPNRADVDCRALYDTSGQVYYRLLSQTVMVSASCTRLRKTENTLYVDDYITSLPAGADAVCRAHGGQWGPGVNGGAVGCQRCAAGGRLENGACVYQANTQDGASASCPAVANGCRVYVGNTGRNVFATVINDSFEDNQSPAQTGWTSVPAGAALRVATEAVIVGEHSLSVPSTVSRVSRTIAVNQNLARKTFRLTFWARAEALQNVEIYLTQGGDRTNASNVPYGNFTQIGTPAGITPGWREFTFGPVTLGDITLDPAQPLELTFARVGNSNSQFFLDYVQLTELADQTALIRNSWQVSGADAPLLCDSTPNDTFPGEALGCKAYTDSRDRTVYATGFESICREAAVGCEPVWDTHNTLGNTVNAEQAQAFNVWCDAPNSAECSARVNAVDYRCTVPRGETGCYIPGPIFVPTTAGFTFTAPLRIVQTTVIVPADTPADAPIFITNRKDVSCRSSELGCTEVGLEERVLPRNDAAAFQFTNTYIQNNPAFYTTVQGNTGILCQAEQLGCQEFRSDNAVTYFRDPQITSGGVCEYLTGQRVGQTTVNGWFLKDVGQCSQNAQLTCRTNNDCGQGNQCNLGAKVACDPTFIRRTNTGVIYDIRSNDSPEYVGRAGVCAPDANLCTEFVDPVDVSDQFPQGRPYYVKNNDKVKAKAQACASGVSQTEGCVLFDQTDNPRKTYSTDVTYTASQNTVPPYGLVAPRSASSQADNDANIVLKVDRDRICSEWLACKGKIVQDVNDGNGKEELCYDYRACDEMDASGKCTHFVSQNSQTAVRPLSEEIYIERPLGWSDPEYTGYSLFDQYQIGSQSYIKFDLSRERVAINIASPRAAEDLAILRRVEEKSYVVYIQSGANASCAQNNPNGNSDWQVCGSLIQGAPGRCYAGQCIHPIGKAFPGTGTVPSGNLSPQQIETLTSALEASSCKAYPEGTAPFADSVVRTDNGSRSELDSRAPGFAPRIEFISRLAGFERANICQGGMDCSCAYVKKTYRNGLVDYWPYRYNSSHTGQAIPEGVCAAGPYQGRACNPQGNSSECNQIAPGQNVPNSQQGNTTNYECSPVQKSDSFYGLEGFCLERDYSRRINGVKNPLEYACLTWLPIDVSVSTFDIYNANDEAGYKPDIDALVSLPNNISAITGQTYCTNATRLGVGLQAPSINPGGPTDNALMSVTDASNRYASVFGNGNTNNYYGDCDDSVEYKRLMCNVLAQSAPYSALQSWAWRSGHIGSNALLLRIETNNAPSGGDLEDYDTFQAITTPINGSSERLYVPGFFANNIFEPDVGDSHLVLSNGQEAPSAAFGALMHPPRQFGMNIPAASRVNLFSYRDSEQQFMVNTELFGVPDLVQPASGTADDSYGLGMTPSRLTRTNQANSNLEYAILSAHGFVTQRAEAATIHAGDLQRVYFVALGFPGELEGSAPDILGNSFYIDFANLRERSANGVGPVFFRSAATVFGDNDGYFGDRSGGNVGVVANIHYSREGANASFPSFDYADMSNGAGYLYEQYSTQCLNGQGAETEWCRKNRIQDRYVAVFFVDRGSTPESGDRFPRFINDSVTDIDYNPTAYENGTSPISDPFVAACKDGSNGGDGDSENWVAIGMDFNEDGEFLGFISRWCNESTLQADDFSDGIAFATIATMADQCTAFTQVYNPDALATEHSNKAWTNRVWEHATNLVRDRSLLMFHPAFGDVFTKNDMQNVPFGSLNNPSLNSNPQSLYNLRNYGFQLLKSQVRATDGIPYACSGNMWYGSPYLLGSSLHPCSSLAVDRQGEQLTQNQVTPLRSNSAAAEDALSRLFAMAFTTVSLPGVENRPTNVQGPPPQSTSTLGFDRSGGNNPVEGIANLLPPQVYSLNPQTCQTPISGRSCSVGEANNMTINELNGTMANYDRSVDGSADEDTDRSGFPDPLIDVGTMAVRMRFFAAADDNKMPIRQVRVDWGDGSRIVNDGQVGLYKNRKPYCATEDSSAITVGVCGANAGALTSITCRTHADCPVVPNGNQAQTEYRCYGATATADQDASTAYQFARFGNSPRACTPRPFTFTTDYSCPLEVVQGSNRPAYVRAVSTIRNADARIRLRGEYGLNDNDFVCVFQPRVQVVDNWGWCNATGADGITATAQGLYDSQCDMVTPNNNPWTPYRGEIIVVPGR